MSLEATMAESPDPRPPSLVRDLVRLFTSPQALFEELPERQQPARRSLLILLILLHAGLGWVWTATGIPDYEIDSSIQREIARTSAEHEGEESTTMLSEELDLIERSAGFWKFLDRMRLWIARPLGVAAGVMLLAGLLHGWVALAGGRPNYPLTLEVTTLAAYVLLGRVIAQVALTRIFETTAIETSLASLLADPRRVGLTDYLLLRRCDPFLVWFWTLVALGLVRAQKLAVRPAVVGVVLLAFLDAALAAAADAVRLVDFQELVTG